VNVGDLYTDGHNVWEIETYCDRPTVTLKNIHNGNKLYGAIGCSNFSNLVKLVPETKIKEGNNDE